MEKLRNVKNDLSSDIKYEFSVPYSGGCRLELINHSSQPILLQALQFTSNVNITGNPWGTLWSWGANMTVSSTQNGQNFIYTVTEAGSGVPISANSRADLSFTVGEIQGILPIAMDPERVNADVSGQGNIKLYIEGICIECSDPAPQHYLGGYYTSWDQYARQYNAADLPVNKLNGILYAFIGFNDQGNLSLLDSNSDSKQLPAISMQRKRYGYLNASLSFGGWTLSGPFSALAANPESRKNFINNAISAMKQVGFNGIDIDWEYPVNSPQDSSNFAQLLLDFRAALNAQAQKDGVKRYYLSIAAPAGIDKIQAIQKNDPTAWQKVSSAIDHLNLMAYDFHGAFDKPNPASHQSAMTTAESDPYYKNPVTREYNVQDAVNAYLELGFDPKKVVVGAPAYVRTEYVTNMQNNGLYQDITGTPPGQFDDTGVYDYRCVIGNDCKTGKSMPTDTVSNYDNVAQVPYWSSNSTQIFGTGDNEQSVANKAHYVSGKNLGGMMFWTLSGDTVITNAHSLIASAQTVLGTTANRLDAIKPATQTFSLDEQCVRVQPPLGGRAVLNCGSFRIVPHSVGEVFENFSDNYDAGTCQNLTAELGVCPGEKSNLEFSLGASTVQQIFDNAPAQLMLGAVGLHLASKFIKSVKNLIWPEPILTGEIETKFLLLRAETELTKLKKSISSVENNHEKNRLEDWYGELQARFLELSTDFLTLTESKREKFETLVIDLYKEVSELKVAYSEVDSAKLLAPNKLASAQTLFKLHRVEDNNRICFFKEVQPASMAISQDVQTSVLRVNCQ